MTESEWLASEDPHRMLDYLCAVTGSTYGGPTEYDRKPSDRKLRLFAVACCRQVWSLLADDVLCPNCDGRGLLPSTDGDFHYCLDCHSTGRINCSRKAVEVAERFADGKVTKDSLCDARWKAASVWENVDGQAELDAETAMMMADECCHADAEEAADFMVREKVLPSREIVADLLREIVGNPFAPQDALAFQWQQYQTARAMAEEAYANRDWGLLPILADNLADAGCENAALLAHLRSDANHVRGCFALDCVLGKE